MKYKNFMDAVKVDATLCTTIAMEECSELIKAVSKAKRGKLDKENMAEEIGDVLICIDWLKSTYNINQDDINIWMKIKKNRVVDRLNKGDFK